MLTQHDIYLKAQAACGLSVGDYVRVMYKCESYFGGWDSVWYREMDDTIGDIFSIEAIYDKGVQLKNIFVYPFFVLQPVANHILNFKFKPFDRVLVRDSMTSQWTAAIFSHEDYLAGSAVYRASGRNWQYCIPYEGNEHLLGTTEPEY